MITNGSGEIPLSEHHAKVRWELKFYFWTGFILYLFNNILNGIDFHLRYEWDPVAYMGFVGYFALNFYLILEVKRMKYWARNVFIIKFIVFAFMFYPQTVMLKSGSWMYSDHFPHGVLQKMSNFGNFAYELFFVLYLIKRSVRYVFVHPQ